MDAELEVLSRTLRRTLTSLQNKRAYLLEQQHNYIGIRGKLLLLKESYRDSRTRGDTDELSLEKVDTLRGNGNGNGNEGLVFKDVVISNGKCYLNIGYEYYVEKGIEECLQFVDDKLTSIEDALVQFDKKIGEANDTMRGMSVYENGAGSSKDGSRIEEGEKEEEDQIMEIREELDDEGNIISSSVRPKPTEKDIEKLHESMVEGMKRTTPPKVPQMGNDDSGRLFLGDDFKKNLKGKLLSRREHTKQHISRDKAVAQGKKHKTGRTKMQDGIEKIGNDSSVSKNEDKSKKEANSEDTSVKQGSVTEVATDNIYTFDDLVRQLDEQDELEDGKIEEADIDYSMERFDLNSSLARSEPTDEEGKEVGYDDDDDLVYHNDEDPDDDDLDSQRYSIVPNSAGRLSFLDQINKLRSPKLQREAPRVVVQKSVSVTKKSSQSAPPKKSILKRATVNEKSNEKKTTEPQKEKKKNVGFAETLDIYEVENLKEETKRQTANFPRMPLMTPTTTKSNEDENGFDSDLFAQLIGARNPDELHDKYQEKIREIQAKEDAHLEESRGRRVSRFKKERHANEDDESALLHDETDSTKSNGKGSSCRAVMDIVEHDLEPETQTPATVGKRVSKFAQRMASKQATTSATTTTTTTTREPFVVKEMKSLQRPRLNNSGRGRNSSTQLMSQKILEELSDSNGSGDEHNNADENVDAPDKIPVKTVDNKAASQNTRIKEKLEKTGDKFEFPEEIKKILKERGKGEDSVRVANVDYSGLNDNLDDMARAYILGLYDDDLEEHPGTLVEKLDDFKSYNKQVDELKDDIDTFRRENPVLRQVREGDDNENKDGSIMVDVVEHDLPEDYARDIMEDDDNYALNPDKLGEEVRRSYFEKREYMIQKLRNMSNENGVVKDIHEEPTGPIILPSEEMEEHELEPIDESGNPIKVSKFKAKRMNLRI